MCVTSHLWRLCGHLMYRKENRMKSAFPVSTNLRLVYRCPTDVARECLQTYACMVVLSKKGLRVRAFSEHSQNDTPCTDNMRSALH